MSAAAFEPAVLQTLAEATSRSVVQPLFFLRIASDPVPVRAMSSIGRRRLPADAVETVDGAAYVGAGMMANLPELQSLFAGESQSIELRLSGVDARTVALVDEAQDALQGAAAWFGYAFLDSRRRMVTPVYWDFEGEVETVDWVDEPGQGEMHRRREVSVRLVGDFADRRTRDLQTVAPVDQALRDATDLAFQHVPNLEFGATADWPLK